MIFRLSLLCLLFGSLIGIEQQQAIKIKHQMRPKQIRFTSHAIERMDGRRISRGEVEKAIKNGTRTVNKSDGSVIFMYKNLIIVMDPAAEAVITVYTTNKPEDELLRESGREKTKEREIKRNIARESKIEKRNL